MALLTLPITARAQDATLSENELLDMARRIVWIVQLEDNLDGLLANHRNGSGFVPSAESARLWYNRLLQGSTYSSVDVELDSIMVLSGCVLRMYRFTDGQLLHGSVGYLALTETGVPYRLMGFDASDIDSLIQHCFGGIDSGNALQVAELAKCYLLGDRYSVSINSQERLDRYRADFPSMTLPNIAFELFPSQVRVVYYVVSETRDGHRVHVHQFTKGIGSGVYSIIEVTEQSD